MGNSDIKLLRIKRCSKCGKRFAMYVPVLEYGYTIMPEGGTFPKAFCSYSCMRAYEIPIIAKKKAKMDKQFEMARAEEL